VIKKVGSYAVYTALILFNKPEALPWKKKLLRPRIDGMEEHGLCKKVFRTGKFHLLFEEEKAFEIFFALCDDP